jgi:hypothetical protein
MPIIKPPSRNSVIPKIIALTPMNLYLERVKGVSEKLRAGAEDLDYIPLQFGGIKGQQESLQAASTIKVIDFKVINDE